MSFTYHASSNVGALCPDWKRPCVQCSPRTACAATSGGAKALTLPSAPIRASEIFRRAGKAHHRSARKIVCLAAAGDPSLQLATAKLPPSVDVSAFKNRMYDWASSMTSSGRNMPFSLPLRTRKTSEGFEISLLRINNGEPVDVGTIAGTVEEVEGKGDIFFARFFEGRGASLVRSAPLPSDPSERLKTVINGLVDIPTIMGTMKTAIRQAASASGKR